MSSDQPLFIIEYARSTGAGVPGEEKTNCHRHKIGKRNVLFVQMFKCCDPVLLTADSFFLPVGSLPSNEPH